jgi:DNA-binding transcriptional LysR family regulator
MPFRSRDLPLLAVFAAVARQRSITGAARELGLSKSVISEQLRALEEKCGARVLERSSRHVELTQLGEQLLAVSATLADASRAVDAILDEHRDGIAGTLRIATTHDLGTRVVAPALGLVVTNHPELRSEMVTDDMPHDLIGERFDLAVRLGAPKDSQLVMRKLCSFEEPIVAAPALAAKYKRATRPSDLAGAPWVKHALVQRIDSWIFRGPRRERDEIEVAIRGSANTGDGVRALLVAGVGCGVLPEYQLADDIKRGALVELCRGWSWKSVSLYALLPSRKPPRRVELFIAACHDVVKRNGWS